MGVTEYPIDALWEGASELKALHSLAIGDAYAVAAARELDTDDGRNVTLLVDADDDYDGLTDTEGFDHLIERFRNVSV